MRGSALSISGTPVQPALNKTANYVSLRELVKQKDPINLSDLKFDDANYVVPTFNWRKPKFIESRSKKLDYIYVFSDK